MVVTQIFQSAVRGIADYFSQHSASPIGYCVAGCHPPRYPVGMFKKMILSSAMTLTRKLRSLTRYRLCANHLMHVLLG